MSNSAPCGWARRPDLSALSAHAAAMGAVVESIQALMPLHMAGAELDPATDAKLGRWMEVGHAG